MKQTVLVKIVQVFSSLGLYQKIALLLLLWIGITIRVANFFHYGFYFDTIVTQYIWADTARSQGIWSMWRNYTEFLDYLPIGVLYIDFIAIIGSWFGSGSYYFIIVLKLFNTLADGLFSLLVVWATLTYHKKQERIALWLGVISFLLPGLWLNSAIWGQMDSLVIALSTIAAIILYCANNKKEYIISGVLFVIAFYLKSQSLLFLPLVAWILFQKSVKNAVYFGLSVVVLLIINVMSKSFAYSFYLNFIWIPLLITGSTWFYYVSKLSSMNRYFVFTFMTGITAIFSIFSTAHLEKTSKNVFTILERSGEVSNSANNIHPILRLGSSTWNTVFTIGSIPINVSLVATTLLLSLFGMFILYVFGTNWKKISDSIKQANFLYMLYVVTGLLMIYFIFGLQMRERYSQTASMLFIVLVGMKQKVRIVDIIMVIIFNLGLFVNVMQIYVRGIQEGNTAIEWLIQLNSVLPNQSWFNISFFLIPLAYLLYFKQDFLKHKQLITKVINEH